MKLPTKLPANMDEAKAMFKDIADQVVDEVTRLCNSVGKKPEEKKEAPSAEDKPAEKKE